MSHHNIDVYQLALSSANSLTLNEAERLVNLAGSERRLFEMSESELASLVGRNNKFIGRAERNRLLAEAEAEKEALKGRKIEFIYHKSPQYPVNMREVDDAPLRLFVAGECDLNAKHKVAIVGTRHSTAYGQAFINSIVAELAAEISDMIIISGGAYGSDIAAHRAAMANCIPTVAVMAHGLNTIYPAAHRGDFNQIVSNGGAVVTEYSLATAPLRGHFLARNRIISAMADCVIVVESGVKGGSMVTARIANEYSRQVFALPGRVTDTYSMGCNRLISTDRARLITSARTLLDDMGWEGHGEGVQSTLTTVSETPIQFQPVINLIRSAGGTIDITALSSKLSQSPSETMSLVIEMEFNGLLTILPGSKVMLL